MEFSKYGAFLCLWDTDEAENQKTYQLLYTQYNHRRMVAMKVDITLVIFTDFLFHTFFFRMFQIVWQKKFIVPLKRFDVILEMSRLLYRMQVDFQIDPSRSLRN